MIIMTPVNAVIVWIKELYNLSKECCQTKVNKLYNTWCTINDFCAWARQFRKIFLFLIRFEWYRQKWICISIYLFTASFVYKNICTAYSHKHQKMMMNNILTSGGLNTMSFSTICIFREYVTWRVVCLSTKCSHKFQTLWVYCCLYHDRSFINIVTSPL